MPDCFDMNVCYNDCVFGGEVTNNMISIANTKLNIQPINTPALLFGGQCLELISVYLSEYYNIDVNANELYMNYNVDDAISLSTFKKRVDDHVIQRINKRFYIVNNSDGVGSHWFAVALGLSNN